MRDNVYENKSNIKWILICFFCSLVALLCYKFNLLYLFQVVRPGPTYPCEYIRTVDGDTIVVNIDHREERVRLIGVDAPESVHPDSSKNTSAGKKVSDFTKSYFKPGQILYLEYDRVKKDKYGRTLAYVWLKGFYHINSDYLFRFTRTFKKYNFNAILLLNTETKIKNDFHNKKYEDLFRRIK